LKRLLLALLGGFAGYLVAAAASYFLVGALSPNTHDRAVEAAMSAAFFYGPAGSLLGFVLGWMLGGRRTRGAA
jgi:hypothetical protein